MSHRHHMRRLFAAVALLLAAPMPAALTQRAVNSNSHLADFVDPRIGVLGNGDGSVVIGPTLPHGSIHPSPDTPNGTNTGYRMGEPVRGFSQLHASGIGWGRYGNVLLSPQTGLHTGSADHDSPIEDEKAKAYSYRARLRRYGIVVAITPTRHAALYQLTYPVGSDASLLLDLAHQIPGEIATRISGAKVEGTVVHLDSERHSFSGASRYTGGWGGGSYTVYVYGELETTPSSCGTYRNTETHTGAHDEAAIAAQDRVGAWWRFSTGSKRTVQVKLAVSFLSIEHAKSLLHQEIPHWSFSSVEAQARHAWDRTLSSIHIVSADAKQKTIFYTALYHANIMPRDRTGEFARFAADTPMWDDFYATWDVWRTLYPLMLMVNPAMVRGTIASFAERLRVDGAVADSMTAGYGGDKQRNGSSFAASRGTQPDQGGNDIDNIVADAYVKHLKGVDWQSAYAVLKFDAEHERQGFDPAYAQDYRRQGWIRPGLMSISNTLEYAYNDFCAAEVAEGLGRSADAAKYRARSRQWQYLFNTTAVSEGFHGFLQPRNADGSWIAYDPETYPGSWKNYFYEGSSWTYSYFAPHQESLLVSLMGGNSAFAERLGFANEHNLIDFFNEPGFLATTLFHYAGRPDLSTRWMRRFAGDRYSLKGYPGDDDSGAMSSYYVWATIGLMPNAGQDLYFLNAPLVAESTMHRPDEGMLRIVRLGFGDYVQSVNLNGVPLDRAWVRHTELIGDTRLVFHMSTQPSEWGTQKLPPSDAQPATSLPLAQ